jgi:hypothetical protein
LLVGFGIGTAFRPTPSFFVFWVRLFRVCGKRKGVKVFGFW